mgnify:FL=1
MNWVRPAIAVGLLWLVGLLAPPAFAHAGLIDSSPADGAVLDAAPEEIRLTFSEGIAEPAYVVLTGPSGAKLAVGKPTINGQEVSQAVKGDGPGDYKIAFRVISVDGHPVSEVLRFSVRGNPTASPSAEPVVKAKPAPQASWLERHQPHVLLGAAMVALAVALLWISRRSAQ